MKEKRDWRQEIDDEEDLSGEPDYYLEIGVIVLIGVTVITILLILP